MKLSNLPWQSFEDVLSLPEETRFLVQEQDGEILQQTFYRRNSLIIACQTDSHTFFYKRPTDSDKWGSIYYGWREPKAFLPIYDLKWVGKHPQETLNSKLPWTSTKPKDGECALLTDGHGSVYPKLYRHRAESLPDNAWKPMNGYGQRLNRDKALRLIVGYNKP